MASTTTSRTSRNRKPALRKKATSQSLTSLFSTVTQASNGSNDSNTTIKPETASRHKHRPSSSRASTSKKTEMPAERKSSTSSRPPPMSPVSEKPNVFAFMEEDGESESESESEVSQSDTAELYGGEITKQPNEQRIVSSASTASYTQPMVSPTFNFPGTFNATWDDMSLPSSSFHSDSGISVRSSSPPHYPSVAGAGKMRKQTRNLSITSSASRGSSASQTSPSSRILHPRDDVPDMNPEAFYSVGTRPTVQYATYQQIAGRPLRGESRRLSIGTPSVSSADVDPSPTPDEQPITIDASLADRSPQPLYRTFSSLNSRMLSQLQDEISALETSLAALDSSIANSSEKAVLKTRLSPGRQQGERPEQLEYQRAELVRRIIEKLDTYNRALCSHASVTQSVRPASSSEISSYQTWLATHDPDSPAGSDLLSRMDLATILTHRPNDSSTYQPLPQVHSALTDCTAVLVTIIAFKLVPAFFSRLVVGAIVMSAMVYSKLERGGGLWGTGELSMREWGRRAGVYGVAIFVLAVAVG